MFHWLKREVLFEILMVKWMKYQAIEWTAEERRYPTGNT